MRQESPTSRRGFLLRGAGAAHAFPAGGDDGGIHVAGLVVMTRPEHLERVRAALSRLPGAEVHAADRRGKLVVTLDAPSDGAIADLMHRIPDVPGVLACTLAHHHSEGALTPRGGRNASEDGSRTSRAGDARSLAVRGHGEGGPEDGA